MTIATKPWERYHPEDKDEPTYEVHLTMREMGIILLNVPMGNSYDGYSVSWTIHQKMMQGMQSLVNRSDPEFVGKLLAPKEEK